MKKLKVYACYNTDKDVRMSSSSGAIFSLLAEYVLEQQGVIYGVKMSDDCYSAEFTRVADELGLVKLRGSKYLQAKVGNTYKRVKEDLIAGRLVLFSGTGCQVNGLKSFLKKDYDNLLCVDVICHGVPSPTLWVKYVKNQEQKNGGKLIGINFRCKDDSWNDFGMKEILGNIQKEEQKRLYIPKDNDTYMMMFLHDYCLRPSCYECVSKKVKRADLTIADFWGINEVAPEMDDGNGTSLVILRTDKGKKIFKVLNRNLQIKEVSYEDGVRNNPAEYRSCARPQQRDTFFDDMQKMVFEELEKKYTEPIKASLKSRMKRKIKKTMKSILQAIRGGV